VGNLIGVTLLASALYWLAGYFWLKQRSLTRARGASRMVSLALGVMATMAALDSLWTLHQYLRGDFGVPTPHVDTWLYVGYLIGMAVIGYGLSRWIPVLHALDEEALRRARAEAKLSRALDRMRNFNNAMESLGEAYASGEVDAHALIDDALEAVGRALDVEQASFWSLQDEDTTLHCEAMTNWRTGASGPTGVIDRASHPAYFEALLHSRAIVASDAAAHPATLSFSERYLAPRGVVSVLDAPVRAAPGVRGVLSCESIAERRDWTPDEVSIAAAAAQFIGMALMTQDARTLTGEVRRALAAAEDASEAKSAFLARMSHEIRTPLNGVLGMARLLANDITEPRALTRIEIIQRSGETLLSLLNDVLDVSRIEAGVVRIAPEPMNLAELVEDVRALFQPTAAEKGLRLTALIEPGAHREIIADAGRVRQCLVNLVANAIKFTEEGEVSVRVSTLRCDETCIRVRFEVEDTGPGVSAAEREAIFAPFTQTDEGAARRHGGAGLGLTIVRSLARMMGGDACVASDGEKGARFIVTFNAEPGREDDPGAAASGSSKARPLTSRRVLVVDDNAVNLTVAEEFLRVLGATVRTAASGERGLELLAEAPADLILLDIHMPGMDGLEVLRQLRASGGAAAAAPVVALTADAMAGDRERYLDAGMDGYLAKPLDFDLLADEAVRVLAQPRARAV